MRAQEWTNIYIRLNSGVAVMTRAAVVLLEKRKSCYVTNKVEGRSLWLGVEYYLFFLDLVKKNVFQGCNSTLLQAPPHYLTIVFVTTRDKIFEKKVFQPMYEVSQR
jgi:hypothetical protein